MSPISYLPSAAGTTAARCLAVAHELSVSSRLALRDDGDENCSQVSTFVPSTVTI